MRYVSVDCFHQHVAGSLNSQSWQTHGTRAATVREGIPARLREIAISINVASGEVSIQTIHCRIDLRPSRHPVSNRFGAPKRLGRKRVWWLISYAPSLHAWLKIYPLATDLAPQRDWGPHWSQHPHYSWTHRLEVRRTDGCRYPRLVERPARNSRGRLGHGGGSLLEVSGWRIGNGCPTTDWMGRSHRAWGYIPEAACPDGSSSENRELGRGSRRRLMRWTQNHRRKGPEEMRGWQAVGKRQRNIQLFLL